MKNLCIDCTRNKCDDFLPHDECENYEHKITNNELITLFYGMSKTMQKSIYEIMKVTQIKDNL